MKGKEALLLTFIALAVVPLRTANGFDPFTAAAALGAGANALNSITDAAGEVQASADAFSDLYSEVDGEAQVSSDGQRLISQIHEVSETAQELGYSKEELEELGSSLGSDPEKLSVALQNMTKAVRTGKHLGRLVMKLDRKAQLAQIEQAATSREQLVATYEGLNLERQSRLDVVREKLEAQRNDKDQILALKKEEKGMGAKVFGSTGVLSFPRATSVIEEALKIATGFRAPLLGMLLFVFLTRSVFHQFGLSSPHSSGELIKDTLLCALLLFVFPELVRACVSLTGSLASQVGLKEVREIEPGHLDFTKAVALSVKSRLPLEWAFQWLKYAFYVAAQFFSNFGLAFLVLLFPLVIFGSQMLGFAIAWPMFLGGFLSICLWPLLWNATGSLALLLWKKEGATLSDQIATLLFSLLQFLSPLICVAVLRGQGMAKTAHGAGRLLLNTVTSSASTFVRQGAGVVAGVMGAPGGGTLGRALAYPVNQGISRTVAGVGRFAGRETSSYAGQGGSPTAGQKESTLGRLKAGAEGFVLNHGKAPAQAGPLPWFKQAAQGLKSQPLIAKAAPPSGKSGFKRTRYVRKS